MLVAFGITCTFLYYAPISTIIALALYLLKANRLILTSLPTIFVYSGVFIASLYISAPLTKNTGELETVLIQCATPVPLLLLQALSLRIKKRLQKKNI